MSLKTKDYYIEGLKQINDVVGNLFINPDIDRHDVASRLRMLSIYENDQDFKYLIQNLSTLLVPPRHHIN